MPKLIPTSYFPLSAALLLFACAPAPTKPPVATPPPPPAQVNTGIARTPHVRPLPGQIPEMTLPQLGNFPFDPVKDTDIPPDVKLLDNTRIRLTGYFVPLSLSADDPVSEFALIPFYSSSRGPPIEQTVICKLPVNTPVEPIDGLVTVDGILRIRIQREKDFTHTIFEMDAITVQPQTKDPPK